MAIITGTNGDDQEPFELEGTNLVDEIYGLAGNDTLVGFEGDDLLEGGSGADKLFGSGGFDYASYRGSGQGVYVDLRTGSAFSGDAAGDRLYSIEGLIGSAHSDQVLGTDGREVLRGEGGTDLLKGYGGADLLVGGGGGDSLVGGAGADELRGGAGFDYVAYGESLQAVRIDLAAGTGFGGDAEGDRLFSIEGIFGSELNDRLAGNGAANRFEGDTGADILTGGGGADQFIYSGTDDSNVSVGTDRVLDFSRFQGDKIDLAELDANAQASDGQGFQFIGKSAFTGAGQLRWFHQNGDTIIEGNTTDAFAGAELTIVLDPLVSLQATDFVL